MAKFLPPKILFPLLFGLSSAAYSESAFVPDPVGIDFIKYMIRDDYIHYLDGGTSLLSYRSRVPTVKAVAPQLVSDYRRDPVAAEAKYKGKVVRLSAAIRSIKIGPDGSQYVDFIGGQSDFEDPRGNFGKRIALFPDSTESYVCVVTGKAGPQVRLDQCNTFDQEVDWNNKYLIPNYINQELNEWFGYGVEPEFLLHSRQNLKSYFFAIYWAGTKAKNKAACPPSQPLSQDCLMLVKNLVDSAKSGDPKFLGLYRQASQLLKLGPTPEFSSRLTELADHAENK